MWRKQETVLGFTGTDRSNRLNTCNNRRPVWSWLRRFPSSTLGTDWVSLPNTGHTPRKPGHNQRRSDAFRVRHRRRPNPSQVCVSLVRTQSSGAFVMYWTFCFGGISNCCNSAFNHKFLNSLSFFSANQSH